jgi:hypothetical protein
MCIYCGTNKYRKIYEQHFGSIPKEDNGRIYEIHHIDGDHSNNNPSNLTAITLQEHYDIHYTQRDYNACYLMSVQRMNKTTEEISELSSKAAKQRIADGNWHFSGNDHPGVKANSERIKNGTHHLLDSKMQSKINNIRIKNGNHPSQLKVSCLFCRSISNKLHFGRRHGEKCKYYPKNLKE